MKDSNKVDNKLYYSFLISIGGYIVEYNSPNDALLFAESISDRIKQFQEERNRIQSGDDQEVSSEGRRTSASGENIYSNFNQFQARKILLETISEHPRFAIKGGDAHNIDEIYAGLLLEKKQELGNQLMQINDNDLKQEILKIANTPEDSSWYGVQKLDKLLKILSNTGTSNISTLPKILSVEDEYKVMKEISKYISEAGANVGGLRSIIIKNGITFDANNDHPELGVINDVLQKIKERGDKHNFNEDEKFLIFDQFKLSVINMSHKRNLDVELKNVLKDDYLNVQHSQLDIDDIGKRIGKDELMKFENLKELLATAIIGKNQIESVIRALILIKKELHLDDPIISGDIKKTFETSYEEFEPDKAINKFKDDLNNKISKLKMEYIRPYIYPFVGLLAITATSLLVAFLAPKLIAAASIALIVTGAVAGCAAIATAVYSYNKYKQIGTNQSHNLDQVHVRMSIRNSVKPLSLTDPKNQNGSTMNPLNGREYKPTVNNEENNFSNPNKGGQV